MKSLKEVLKGLLGELPWLLKVVIVFASFFTVAGFSNSENQLVDLGSHFRAQYALLGVVGTIYFFFRYQKIYLFFSVLCILGNLIAFVPQFERKPQEVSDSSSGPILRVMLANVSTKNTSYRELIELVREEKPDLIALLEINDTWLAAIAELSSEFPNVLSRARADNFGIALFSRHPFSQGQVETFSPEQPPSITATVELGGKQIRVYATHPVPPALPWHFKLRNRQLADLAALVRSDSSNSIVIGDLNLTMWSPFFRRFVNDAFVKDVRVGFGILPTWPRQVPFLYIPLDHCLYGSAFSVKQVWTRSIVGSDHRALFTELRLLANQDGV